MITLVLDEYHVMLAFSEIKKSAPGPDGIPHWVWKENADMFAPVIPAICMESITEETPGHLLGNKQISILYLKCTHFLSIRILEVLM